MPIDPAQLARLTHRRWALPVLAELHRMKGAKFVSLVNTLGAHHLAVRQALEELVALGMVVRNPGYGHPLRPEYIISDTGHAAAAICGTINDQISRRGLAEIAYRKWFLPTMLAMHRGAERFAEVRDHLLTATDRSLSLSLNLLRGGGVINARDHHADARAVIYALQSPGRAIAATLDKLPPIPAL